MKVEPLARTSFGLNYWAAMGGALGSCTGWLLALSVSYSLWHPVLEQVLSACRGR